jgi:hypothetical protein
MIYAFGCSSTKYYWPTWVEWMEAYGHDVTNLAWMGYGDYDIYYSIMKRLDQFNPGDKLYISWTQNHRISQWYDKKWIDKHDVLGFFPDTNGKLWHTNKTKYTGLYRTHPDWQQSFTHMLIDQWNVILLTQLVLDKKNIDYEMLFSMNPWADCRPIFGPTFQIQNFDRQKLDRDEELEAREIMQIPVVKAILDQIDWSKFSTVSDPTDPQTFDGVFEYFFTKKEFVILKHKSDVHPNPLANHDFLTEKLLKNTDCRHRVVAKQMSEEIMNKKLPTWQKMYYVGLPEDKLLDPDLKKQMKELK